ncbi:uncharacterized protein TNIN_241411 [Trichonephila inaurata madagascariensis]|uniref:Uncharacterized protein n=1 Tax=Trichonephila inaurata madagascariensis TaxID=2747483 RepID=A0A8X6Y514_9ARAC|nr:uncharacterized protein TNIN_241411 [Trichonephila inaurata madagascariensis]
MKFILIFQRPQLVPNPGSPLSLEAWCVADFESWFSDNTTLMRTPNNGYTSVSMDSKEDPKPPCMLTSHPHHQGGPGTNPQLYETSREKLQRASSVRSGEARNRRRLSMHWGP